MLKNNCTRSDSRCPKGNNDNGTVIACSWKGSAEISVELKVSDESSEVILLNTHPSFDTTGGFMGYTIYLTSLDPYPESLFSIADNAYCSTLLVTMDST